MSNSTKIWFFYKSINEPRLLFLPILYTVKGAKEDFKFIPKIWFRNSNSWHCPMSWLYIDRTDVDIG